MRKKINRNKINWPLNDNIWWHEMFSNLLYIITIVSLSWHHLPISPLELDSVKLGVPSVQVGVDPSFEAGGVHANAPREPYWLPLDVSTAKCGSSRISDILFMDFLHERKNRIKYGN